MEKHTDRPFAPVHRTPPPLRISPVRVLVVGIPAHHGSHGVYRPHGHFSSGRLISMVFVPAVFVMFYQVSLFSQMLWREEEAALDGPPLPLPLPVLVLPLQEQGGKLLESSITWTTEAAPLVGLPLIDRSITLVHVGKAGGSSIRAATSLPCRKSPKKWNTPERVEYCLSATLDKDNVLAHSIHYYCHMSQCHASDLHNSTSFLFLLRNPVDRVISNLRYAHPQNCLELNGTVIMTSQKACNNKKRLKEQGHPAHELFTICFPSAAMEEFAQNVLTPFPLGNQTHHHFVKTNMTLEQQQQCRWIARQFVQGHWEETVGPHMIYNYEYYRNISIGAHPQREMFGVRTEYVWEDMKALDIAMGGNGGFGGREGRKQSHGSESYLPSPLTPEAYHKLCCVLEREIRTYGEIVNQVINLNHTVKQEMMDDVRQKCSVGAITWDRWSVQCQERLEADRMELEPR
jgi:Sulfotransferase family